MASYALQRHLVGRTQAAWAKKNSNKIYPKKYLFYCIYLLVMPKYWVKNYFVHGRFLEVGQKQKKLFTNITAMIYGKTVEIHFKHSNISY